MAINDEFTLTQSDLEGLLDLINGTPGGEEEEARQACGICPVWAIISAIPILAQRISRSFA